MTEVEIQIAERLLRTAKQEIEYREGRYGPGALVFLCNILPQAPETDDEATLVEKLVSLITEKLATKAQYDGDNPSFREWLERTYDRPFDAAEANQLRILWCEKLIADLHGRRFNSEWILP